MTKLILVATQTMLFCAHQKRMNDFTGSSKQKRAKLQSDRLKQKIEEVVDQSGVVIDDELHEDLHEEYSFGMHRASA